MTTLHVKDLRLAFGARDILDGVSFTLTSQSRSALCGANGSGKSTLLKVIGGELKPDSIDKTVTKGMTIAYLPQSDIVLERDSVYSEVEKGFGRYSAMLKEKEEIGERLRHASEEDRTDGMLERIRQIEEELLSSGYYNRKMQIGQVLAGLGFEPSDADRPCGEFSGGWQMRIALARTLVERADLMLLDEPTNYLDIEALTWLKNYLKVYKGGLLLVSHDQGFLDETINEVFELFGGHLKRYAGTYTQYQAQREMEIKELEAKAKTQTELVGKTEQFIERFRYKATKSKQVQSRIKQMEKLEKVEIPAHLKKLEFSFPPAPHCGNDVMKAEHLTKRYGDIDVFDDLSFMIHKGDRLAVTGRNGAGKSTLLRILVGEEPDYQGTVSPGAGVVTGYYAQEAETTLEPKNNVLEELATAATTNDLPKLRTYLGSFLFQGDDVFKPVSVLSGGERSRLALLKILLHPVNLLVLDEPTNHLDINAKQMLLEALKQYDGTMVFVSHDTYFISHVATRILYLNHGEAPQFFEGDWDYFSYKLNEKERYEEANQQSGDGKKEEKQGVLSYKEANKLRNRIISLERRCKEKQDEVAKLEETVKDFEKDTEKPAVYSDPKRITEIMRSKNQTEQEKQQAEDEWFSLQEELEALKSQVDK